uniref:Ovule protein n=1 Tax=Strongyloides venezuelensis TaxID=75913 RepID=A0A0K0F312_STRVS
MQEHILKRSVPQYNFSWPPQLEVLIQTKILPRTNCKPSFPEFISVSIGAVLRRNCLEHKFSCLFHVLLTDQISNNSLHISSFYSNSGDRRLLIDMY